VVLPSEQQYIIDNRAGWARMYLKKAELLESTKRSNFEIANLGLEVLQKNLKEINVKFLEQYLQFIECRNLRKEKGKEEKKIRKLDTNTTIAFGVWLSEN
jgi:restriction system protein